MQTVKQAYAFGDATIIQEGVVKITRASLWRGVCRHMPGIQTTCSVLITGTGNSSGRGTALLDRHIIYRQRWLVPRGFSCEKTIWTVRGSLQVHFSAVDPSGETWQQEAYLPVSDYRYTILSRLKTVSSEAAGRILVLEKGPSLAIEVKNSTGFDQEVSGSYSLSRNGIIRFSGSFTGKETLQPSWSALESGRWELFRSLDAQPTKNLSGW